MNPVLAARQKKRASEMSTRFAVQDDRIVIAQSQDCTPIAEIANTLRQAGAVGSSDMRHAAKIPDVILNKYMNENGVSYQELMTNPVHLKRICNDPANAAFRIWKGVI